MNTIYRLASKGPKRGGLFVEKIINNIPVRQIQIPDVLNPLAVVFLFRHTDNSSPENKRNEDQKIIFGKISVILTLF